ncbi:BMC domain-containing protein [Sodalis sp. RH21]|uniref:BMC domain-containing protein n=1 Tax=unclassified Sodalis (in: enterobacteria) TaxID=2636512 RepID=UPI0039B6E810
MKTSLGLLEVAGLALAIKVADTMAKAANVEIAGIEKTNGSGWMLVTITGDVAAVSSAVNNGAELARRENGWVADRVIARPADALAAWLTTREQLAAAEAPAGEAAESPNDANPAAGDVAPITEAPAGKAAESANDANPAAGDVAPITEAPAGEAAESASVVTPSPAAAGEAKAAAMARYTPKILSGLPGVEAGTCNLCHDPACPRRKGEPRAACIHNGERGEV